jgi:hypothetical protein
LTETIGLSEEKFLATREPVIEVAHEALLRRTIAPQRVLRLESTDLYICQHVTT